MLQLDLVGLLAAYTAQQFLYLKGLRLCANMMVKAAFTSDNMYTLDSLPRDVALFVPKVCCSFANHLCIPAV